MKLRRNVLQPLRLDLDTPPVDLEATAAILGPWLSRAAASGENHFASRPTTLLQHYSQQRHASAVGHWFRAANRLHTSVDTVVVLCRGDAGAGAQAIVQACSQPYWNHLSRADRGSKPRMFFVSDQSDNDAVQGLLHMLGAHRPTSAKSESDLWALLVLSPNPTAGDDLWPLEELFSALLAHAGHDPRRAAQRVLAVAPKTGWVADRVRALGSDDIFDIGDEPAPFQCFGPLGMLPAAILGINVMELLAGAAWVSDHAGRTSPDQNLVLRWIDWQRRYGCLDTSEEHVHFWSSGLQSWHRWCRALAEAEPLDATMRCASPRGRVHIVIERPRFDPIPLGDSRNASDHWRARVEEVQRTERAQGFAVAEIRLSELDELHMGQLMQWSLFASASSRLDGSSPSARSSSDPVEEQR